MTLTVRDGIQCGIDRPSSPTTPTSQYHHRDDTDRFPQDRRKLTLEAVKRIWSSYSPVGLYYPRIHKPPAHAEDCATDENALGLDLGSTLTIIQVRLWL